MTDAELLEHRKTKKSIDGLTAYDILRKYPDCPIRLPVARSMTQASIDYYSLQVPIIEWYHKNHLKP